MRTWVRIYMLSLFSAGYYMVKQRKRRSVGSILYMLPMLMNTTLPLLANH